MAAMRDLLNTLCSIFKVTLLNLFQLSAIYEFVKANSDTFSFYQLDIY